MPKLYGFLSTLCCTMFLVTLGAQNCNYRFDTFDSFGDGWNGGVLTYEINGVSTDFSLTNDLGDGDAFSFTFPVQSGDEIILSYVPGAFAGEVSFILFNSEGLPLFQYGPNVTAGGDSLFVGEVICPACASPFICTDEIGTRRLRSSSVDLFYCGIGNDTLDGPPLYLIEFGPAGFTPGTGTIATTTDTTFRVQPLMDTTAYDIYISNICYSGQDTSARFGPISIFTPLTTDVGASALVNPNSGCALFQEEIEIGLTNFGGTPQSLIPFNYSINGVPGEVNMPSDGLYTGNLGVDSTEFTSFDIDGDFSAPGNYVIQIWTELAGDQDRSNDTSTFEVFNAPLLSEFPYYQPFEEDGDGFWTDQEPNESLSSWEYGTPSGAVINEAAGGVGAWVTNLDGPHPYGELSFLYSPCFDFSLAETDPVLSFALFNALASGSNGLQFEATTNGVDYFRVGNFGDGLNWYNDQFNNWWDNNFNLSLEWEPTAIKLDGFAGEPNVRFRFRFQTPPFGVDADGVAIDNFLVTPQQAIELAAVAVNGPENQNCGSTEDFPSISFFNLGSDTATSIQLSYQVNGGAVVTETFSGELLPFSQASYTFTTPYDGTQADVNEIVAWVTLDGDNFQLNDTVTQSIIVREALPFFEDFEDGAPGVANWQIDPIATIGETNNAGSTVLSANIYNFEPQSNFTHVSSAYGAVEAGDSLRFDYRFTDFGSGGFFGTELGPSDSLYVGAILDCVGETIPLITISAENHTTTADFTSIALELPEATVGSNIQLIFFGSVSPTGFTDMFVDLDNINLKRCVPLELAGSVSNAPASDSLGSITVIPQGGFEPYTYLWEDGTATATLDSLTLGDYSVTVTDAQGCSDTGTFSVIVSGTEEAAATSFDELKVFPNPTNGLIRLSLQLDQQRSIQLAIYNQFGQQIERRNLGEVQLLEQQIDLSAQPAGVYFLRLLSEGEQRTVRVVKTR